jgi:7-cyano-7-deazaguanine synthase
MRHQTQEHETIHAPSKITILLSGGVDSVSCLAYYLDEGFHPEALFVDYGQAGAKRELRAAKFFCRRFEVPLRSIHLTGAAHKGPGPINGRNAFLILTAALESNANTGFIALGIHSGTEYADCSPQFVRRIQAVLDIYSGGALQVLTPFLEWRKGDIWSFAQSKALPLELTYSCERGLKQPCGSCDSCCDLEKLRAGSRHHN